MVSVAIKEAAACLSLHGKIYELQCVSGLPVDAAVYKSVNVFYCSFIN